MTVTPCPSCNREDSGTAGIAAAISGCGAATGGYIGFGGFRFAPSSIGGSASFFGGAPPAQSSVGEVYFRSAVRHLLLAVWRKWFHGRCSASSYRCGIDFWRSSGLAACIVYCVPGINGWCHYRRDCLGARFWSSACNQT